jgi:hypothetical protein
MTSLSATDIRDLVNDAIKMSMASISTLNLKPFTGYDSRELEKWLREFEYHAEANNWDDAIKMRKFPIYLRDYGLLWYDQNVKRSPSPPTSWRELKQLILNDLLSTDHKSYLYNEIIHCKQASNESVYNYILTKRDLCLELDDRMKDSDLIEYLFQGLKPEIAKLLRSHAPRNLDSFIKYAKQIERGIEESEDFHEENKTSSDLFNLMYDIEEAMQEITQALRNSDNYIYSNAAFRQSNVNGRQCADKTRHEYNTHHKTVSAHRKICYNCHQYGHYARFCPSIRDSLNNDYKMYQKPSYCQAAHQVISPRIKSTTLMFINVKINDSIIKGLVDTGSEITMISHELALGLGLSIDNYKGHKINSVNGLPVEITGQSKINVIIFDDYNERVVPITVLTIQKFHLKFLLGYDFQYASKSLIDIFNNKIIFDPRSTRNRQIINKLHNTNIVEEVTNCLIANGLPPIDVETKLKVKAAGTSNTNIVTIKHTPQRICASANFDEKFDVMNIESSAKIVKNDFLAYELFKEILDRAKPNSEIWPIALKICDYCISLDCNLGDQCPKRTLNGSADYFEDVFLRRMNVYTLCLEYDSWLLCQQSKVKEETANKNIFIDKILVLHESDLKEIAECMFQDLYTRAIYETNDQLNVIYYYHRLCNYCNRYGHCDSDQKCNFKPLFDKSENFRKFKLLERQEFEILMIKYQDRHQVSEETFEKYRLTENKLKRHSTVVISKERSQKSESNPILIENNKIGKEKATIIDNWYENNNSHDSSREIKKEVFTSNDTSLSKEENTEKTMSCVRLY